MHLEPKEQLGYDYIKENIKKNGYSPSIRDICSALGIKSTSTVHLCLDRLEKKGYIQKENGKSRTLRIEGVSPEESSELPMDFCNVPILGRVTAGQPILAVEEVEEYIPFGGGSRYTAGDLFALRVRGTSMINAGILDGDIIIVRRTPSAENGDIVVAMIEDEATVKRIYYEPGRIRLQPENDAYEPIYATTVTVLGRVIALQREM